MISKQSMVDHIRKLQSEAAQKHEEAMASQNEVKRLIQVLVRDIKNGQGTTGDSALDMTLVMIEEFDERFADYIRGLNERWLVSSKQPVLIDIWQPSQSCYTSSTYYPCGDRTMIMGEIVGNVDFRYRDKSLALPIDNMCHCKVKDIFIGEPNYYGNTFILDAERLHNAYIDVPFAGSRHSAENNRRPKFCIFIGEDEIKKNLGNAPTREIKELNAEILSRFKDFQEHRTAN